MHQQNNESVLRVSELWVYPVKSLGGIQVQESTVLSKGLQYDRRWMLVDENNRFMTQRTNALLALFRLQAGDDGFFINYEGQTLHLPLMPQGVCLNAQVWEDEVEVQEVCSQVSEWFSARLNMPCKLVYFPEEHTRFVDPDFAIANDQTSLSDGYPVLIIGQASLDDLNSRLLEPVPMNRFRPNIVFTGGNAFAEDGWRQFNIGNAQFAAVKPCGRCVMTTVNQETASKGTEPLATLSAYRKQNNKVLFGQNVLVLQQGRIVVGDEVLLLKSMR